jgi:manganese transport protein
MTDPEGNRIRGSRSLVRSAGRVLLSVGPGLFGVGYTIGTGSVTTMSKAGADYGTELLWVLAGACVFSFVLLEAFGRYAVVTGETTVHAFRTRLGLGRRSRQGIAVVTIIGVTVAQWTALSGILGLTSNAMWETLRLFVPALPPEHYWAVLGIAAVLILVMYGLVIVGRYSVFEKVLVSLVTLMGAAFVVSMFIVLPPPSEIASGFAPRIPEAPGAPLVIAALVGTTMAAPTFVVRPLLLKGKGWTGRELGAQRRDAVTAAVLTFVVSGAIIVTAAGALHEAGLGIHRVLDMAAALEPIAGRFAVALFMLGVMSAGLSSVFPILLVLPWLVADYQAGEIDTRSRRFRVLAAVACGVGLAVPVMGGNPILAQIATQVFSIFILPLAIACMAYLVNQERSMGPHRAGPWLNLGLAGSFVFACVISWTAVQSLVDLL